MFVAESVGEARERSRVAFEGSDVGDATASRVVGLGELPAEARVVRFEGRAGMVFRDKAICRA